MNGNRSFLLVLIPAMLVVFSVSTLSATTYYVSSSTGSDSNSGTSSSSPWQSLAKVNSSAFSAGDSVLFMRGDVWVNQPLIVPSSGQPGNPITFGAYGTGNLPKFDGNDQEYWNGLVRINGESWITIENLEITNVQKNLLDVFSPSTGVTVQNCEIHSNTMAGYNPIEIDAGNTAGGVTQFTFTNNLVYDGQHDGIKFRDGVSYATVSNNTFYHIMHDAIDTLMTTAGNAPDSNFTIFGNNIYDCKTGMYLPGLNYAEIYDNDIHDDWPGTSPDGVSWSNGIKISNERAASSHITVRNNRIWNITTAAGGTSALWDDHSDSDNWWNNTIYNCYNTFIDDGTATNLSNENNLAYACANSTTALPNFSSDPKFVSPTTTPPDFHLQAGSPAIDAGTNVGLPYSGSAPDLGAYEYVATTIAPPSAPTGLVIVQSP